MAVFRRIGAVMFAGLALSSCDTQSAQVRVAGSSTVYPFTKAVAEAFVKADGSRTAPIVDSTGTEPGIERFCAGNGKDTPDIADASRRISLAEFNRCQANRVREIIEVPIGLDGIALAESAEGPKLKLTKKEIYLALAANPMGKPNAAKTWKDVNPSLPAIPIQVLGPPSTSGTREVFVERLLQAGCLEAMPSAQELRAKGDPAQFDRICRQIRSDSAYVAEGEDDSVIVRGLARSPNAVGLFGYSYLEENARRLRAVPIDGVAPDNDAISSGKYPGGRTLYLYVKKKQLKDEPAVRDFLNLYTTMWDPGGPLAEHGLIALPAKARSRAKETIKFEFPLEATSLM